MSYISEVLADSPLVYWKLDDASGNAADSSGNSRTGTPAGTGPTYGKPTLATDVGAAALLNSHLSSPSFSTPGTQKYTMEVWIQGSRGAASVGGFSYTNGRHVYYDSGSGRTGFNSGVGDCYGPVINVFDGVKRHLVAVFNPGGAFSTGKIYINSVLQTLGGTGGTNTFGTPGGVISAGGWPDSTGVDATGVVYQHFALYAGELSAARILAHYQAGHTLTEGEDVFLEPDAAPNASPWRVYGEAASGGGGGGGPIPTEGQLWPRGNW